MTDDGGSNDAGNNVGGRRDTILKVADLVKDFPSRTGFGTKRAGGTRAVDHVSFELAEGETLGLVGESGCGKSTTARCIVRLLTPTSGEIDFRGKDIAGMKRRAMRDVRREMQMVFQDPVASLDPRMTVNEIIAEPLRIFNQYRNSKGTQRVRELLNLVGLKPDHANRYPQEFSGGQRQRIGIARALALDPKLLVLDEPVSALDVSIQAQIINLLQDLQREYNLSYLFIAHDLDVVRHISDRIAVMYQGKIVEIGDRDQIFDDPQDRYTKSLLSAVPITDPSLRGTKQRISLG